MGISAGLGIAGLQPAVCTSTTRPGAPYEGQMIYETDSNRVVIYDGSSWVMVSDADAPPALQLIKTVNVGSAVSSVEVTGAFTSECDSYKIVWVGGTMSSNTAMTLKLGSQASGYYGFMTYGTYSGSTISSAQDNNAGVFTYVGGGDANIAMAECELFAPYSTLRTTVRSFIRYGAVYGNYVGVQDNNTSFTAFTLLPYTGTMTGGTIRVYGYRNSI